MVSHMDVPDIDVMVEKHTSACNLSRGYLALESSIDTAGVSLTAFAFAHDTHLCPSIGLVDISG